ncbi:protein phosphatase 2C domain-containing protein [Mycobacterium sp. Y57]|uniref:PP2C family serine/threonine-protein phosphatase n=1 Tax=Mycolicibacterium xanthum TaxID=2796469 RepID=UPI001C865897|nr:protein phosphatase 2C domain-containing protein [Mycolicibacterium xanthum]MBX7435399.1 protein phosphatase 2C domain-containing protein [Mycolicibacterium xanthum]
MTGRPACPTCATPVTDGDRFCENCGAALAEVRQITVPRSELEADGPCTDCGNDTDAQGYCLVCGHRRSAPDRDRAELDRVVLITDRGIHHAGNEDAAAAGMLGAGVTGRPPALAVAVCDGVSTSVAAHKAATAAAAAGVSAMLSAITASDDDKEAVSAGLAQAAAAAANAGTDLADSPSCTYTGALVTRDPGGAARITVGNVGDSRAYWLPEAPGIPERLTVDDSLAQELITAGSAADSDVVLRGAHTLTRWLGADAEPISDSSIRTVTPQGRGVLLLCSDGLWNYLPEAADLVPFVAGADPGVGAQALVEHALTAGGIDNITVAVIPIGGPDEFS